MIGCAAFRSGFPLAAHDIARTLRARDFRWLWAGNVASSFAMNMQMVARGWLVYALTSSALDLAWVAMSFMVPQILLSLWGGVVADRLPKRSILVGAQMLNCIATVLMGIIILTGRVEFWDFIWFGAFNGAVLALSIPARNAFVPDLVPDQYIIPAMALNTTGMNFARIIAPALAGILIAVIAAGDTTSTFGVGIVYMIIAVLYFGSAATLLVVSKPGEPHADHHAAGHVSEMIAGLRYVIHSGPLLALILLSIVPFLFGMPLNTLMPAFVEDVLGGGPDDLGFLLSAMGGGAILGSLMLAAAGDFDHKGAWVIGTCFAWALATMAFGFASGFAFAAVAAAAYGWLSSWNMSLNRGLLQTCTEPQMRGRVMSIDMMSHGLMPLGVIPISLVAEWQGVAVALVVSGLIFIVLIAALLLVSPAVKTMNRELVAAG